MTESQQSVQIKAVKLKRKGDEGYIPEIIAHDNELKLNKTYADCENLCHSDFTKAIKRLNHHIAVLIDKIGTDEFEENEEIDEIVVARGYSLSGAESEIRITLKGYQKTKRGGVFQINTPVLYLETEDEGKQYLLVDDLKEKIKRIEHEARLYIFEAKKFEDPQLSLSMPDAPAGKKKGATKAQILPPEGTIAGVAGQIVDEVNNGKDRKEKGKGTRGRKVAQSASHPSGEAHE